NAAGFPPLQRQPAEPMLVGILTFAPFADRIWFPLRGRPLRGIGALQLLHVSGFWDTSLHLRSAGHVRPKMRADPRCKASLAISLSRIPMNKNSLSVTDNRTGKTFEVPIEHGAV